MSYEYIVPLVLLIVLASLVVGGMLWVVKQIDLDIKDIKEAV